MIRGTGVSPVSRSVAVGDASYNLSATGVASYNPKPVP